jgi:hypothetical protein
MAKKKAPKKRGRPSKLGEAFVKAAKEIINDPEDGKHRVVALTDEDLLFLINDKLAKKDQIHRATFKRWKKKVIDGEKSEEGKVQKWENKCLEDFCALIKKALTNQKVELHKSLSAYDPHWHRFAWIMERKFSEWNKTDKKEFGKKGGGALALEIITLNPEDEKGVATDGQAG